MSDEHKEETVSDPNDVTLDDLTEQDKMLDNIINECLDEISNMDNNSSSYEKYKNKIPLLGSIVGSIFGEMAGGLLFVITGSIIFTILTDILVTKYL